MNRFRTKRKGKDEEGEAGSRFKGFRRGKKAQDEEEPKPEMDLATFLPSDDNFRTSLLMNNLSARFSMLREQDDPHSKIGKASDDSVLFPKRQSRFADFGGPASALRNLTDIAEVESIRGQGSTRGDAYPSDDADSTTGGSIMNRPKPTDGNNLFGGRQKIYKIPVGGTMSGGKSLGRALYDDDVAQSAFQRWKQQERKRRSLEGEKETMDDLAGQDEDGDISRRDSSSLMGYNSKRETSSTTYSISGMARNSTAATSVNSQLTASIKDLQLSSTASSTAPSTSPTPPLDRSITRGRRLYEQHLAQDMHEHHASALTRLDTLSRQRPMGGRSPEIGGVSPSPTALAFSERWANEKRTILTKGSAPNLRTMSPPTSASSTLSPLDTTLKLAMNDVSGASPPLSPPVSDVGDHHPMLPIRPNDLGKATAMGVFQKPTQGYDDSKYAQRQLQLQQGRETPSRAGSHSDSRVRSASGRPPSSSSSMNQQTEAQDGASKQPEEQSVSSNEHVQPAESRPKASLAIPSSLQRPSDTDHPAFRQSPLLARLATNIKVVTEAPSPIVGADDRAANEPIRDLDVDSPTLPMASDNQAGLSGMVRQHLRSMSNTSSVYGGGAQGAPGSRIPSMLFDTSINLVDELDMRGNPWTGPDQDWTDSVYLSDAGLDSPRTRPPPSPKNAVPVPSPLAKSTVPSQEEERANEFASQVADARRRVREKLTSFVELDDGTSSTENLKEASPSLKSKTSRGSLLDRSRGLVGGHSSKAMKMLGLGLSSPSAPNLALSERSSFDEPAPGLATMAREEGAKKQSDLPKSQTHAHLPREPEPAEDDEHVAPGLRAFRQARRELQQRKELETLAKKQQSRTRDVPLAWQSPQSQPEVGDQPQPQPYSPPTAERSRPNNERRPPVSQQPYYPRPSTESLRSASENDGNRSQSRSRSQTRRTHLNVDSGVADEPMPPNNMQARPPKLRLLGLPGTDIKIRSPGLPGTNIKIRSPGLPGTDIKRSPHMPPVAYPSPSSPMSPYIDRSFSSGDLRPGPSRPGYESSTPTPQRSPVSAGPASGNAPPSPPTGAGLGPPTSFMSPRRPAVSPSGLVAPLTNQPSVTSSSLNEAHKRFVDKRMISEPTFIMSTAKVPTVSIPQSQSTPDVRGASESRSRSTSNSSGNSSVNGTPPLPPLNPRRATRDQSRSQLLNGESTLAPPAAPFGRSPAGSPDLRDGNRSFFDSDDEEDTKADGTRRRLQNLNAQAFGQNSRVTGTRKNARELINNINASISHNNGNGSLAMKASGGVGSSYVARGPPVSRAVVTGNLKPSGSTSGLPGGMI